MRRCRPLLPGVPQDQPASVRAPQPGDPHRGCDTIQLHAKPAGVGCLSPAAGPLRSLRCYATGQERRPRVGSALCSQCAPAPTSSGSSSAPHAPASAARRPLTTASAAGVWKRAHRVREQPFGGPTAVCRNPPVQRPKTLWNEFASLRSAIEIAASRCPFARSASTTWKSAARGACDFIKSTVFAPSTLPTTLITLSFLCPPAPNTQTRPRVTPVQSPGEVASSNYLTDEARTCPLSPTTPRRTTTRVRAASIANRLLQVPIPADRCHALSVARTAVTTAQLPLTPKRHRSAAIGPDVPGSSDESPSHLMRPRSLDP